MATIITLPGLIDAHVHLRTPRQEYKEDFRTGTTAALAGGFTTVLDMPNNTVPITTFGELEAKRKLAQKNIVCDIGFYFGSLGDNLEEFPKVIDKVMGLKLYLNHTTGNFIITKETLEKIWKTWPEEKPILLHAEEEILDTVLSLSRKIKRKIHICHLNSAVALQEVIKAKEQGIPVTCGVTPHHLFLTTKDREKLGGFAMMKPELETQQDVNFLWEHLDAIDIIESDHAPHTVKEKQATPPAFGVSGLETTLPLLLTATHEHKLTIADIKRLCYETPSKIFNIQQDAETKIEVDLDEEWTVENRKLQTKCKWSPFNGWQMKGKVKRVFIRGTKVFENDTILAESGFGKILP